MAQLLTVAYKIFKQPQIDDIVSVFGERLTNELTRDATLKGLVMISNTESGTIKLSGLANMTPKLVDLLHKAEKQVQHNSLKTILSLLKKYSAQFKTKA
mmetsp:Transcript_38943/g.59199  ORF Transcript_38943/g.59199 Transcript_38943/m.59199 type:complete len:99 (+) Transcript_38943:1910-2206(+)